MIDSFVDYILVPVMMGLALLLIVGLGFAIWSDVASEKITLAKANWQCSRTETHLMPVMVGKTILQQPQTDCVEYVRR